MPREFGEHPVDCPHRRNDYHIVLRVLLIDFVQNLLYVHLAITTNTTFDDTSTR